MSTVRIGQAAALYGLAPSTLRWWEQQGVLGVAEQRGGRRRYGEDDLRRIGVAYLCHVTGTLPLAQTAEVIGDGAGLASRHRVLHGWIAELERKLEDLRAARDHLSHLLGCTEDDLADCPYLDGALATHTPRGRVTEPDILTAAREAGR